MADSTQVKQRFRIVGESRPLLHAIDRALRVAPVDLSVLITGPSGAGKEVFPKIIHQYGSRKHRPYIAVNCGAIPEGTIDSELFGHEKGSFTGAISARKGYFEEADGGTIFLDEVAELPLTTQARLLRVLESGEYLRVGSSQVSRTDVRIVAATNVDLPRAVAAGRFREDLYYRLSTIVIDVPPLRDRGDDIILLARKFAADFAEQYRTAILRFAPDAQEVLLHYSWPGNVRQLKNVVEQLALFEAGRTVDARTVSEALPRRDAATPAHLDTAADYRAERELLWTTVIGLQAELRRLRDDLAALRLDPDPQPSAKAAPLPDLAAMPPARTLLGFTERPGGAPGGTGGGTPSDDDMPDADDLRLLEALRAAGGNRADAARALGISPRTLYRRLMTLRERYPDLDIPSVSTN